MGVPETEKGVEFNMDSKRKHAVASQIGKGGQREFLENKEENRIWTLAITFSAFFFCGGEA